MENRVNVELICDNKIISQTVYGDMDERMAREVHDQSELLRKKTENPKKILVLANSINDGKASSKARKILYKALKEPFIYKFAAYGMNSYGRAIINFAIYASGTKKMKMFKTRENAIEWLLEE